MLPPHVTSMGPRLFSVDFVGNPESLQLSGLTSMGPRLFSVDFCRPRYTSDQVAVTSMGPRLFSVDFHLREMTNIAFPP